MNAMACVPCIFSLLGSASFFPVASKERNSEHILDLLSIPSMYGLFTYILVGFYCKHIGTWILWTIDAPCGVLGAVSQYPSGPGSSPNCYPFSDLMMIS